MLENRFFFPTVSKKYQWFYNDSTRRGNTTSYFHSYGMAWHIMWPLCLHIYKMKKLNSVFCIPGASLVALMVKNLLQCRRIRFDPWVGKTPWRREWLPTPVFLPGEFHGQRSLEGYSPWGHKEPQLSNWHFASHSAALKECQLSLTKSICSCSAPPKWALFPFNLIDQGNQPKKMKQNCKVTKSKSHKEKTVILHFYNALRCFQTMFVH